MSKAPQRRDPHAEHRGPLPPGAPASIGRYEVLRMLGGGGFGHVYLAFDPELERYVAIKAPILPPDSHRAFQREARAIADIHHPHVCPVYDVGVQGKLPYIVMRYVNGGTLGDLIEREPPTPTDALHMVGQIANGLEEAHANGLFHRDLKPANVLHDEKSGKLLITDFGLARWLETTTQTSGGVKGTPAYMAPEQWDPDGAFGPVTARTDLYSLGVILFRLLTGAPLFAGSHYQLMRQHCETEPRKPTDVNSKLDPRLDELCLKALAKPASARYGSAKEFAEAVAAYLKTAPTPVAVAPKSPKPAPPSPPAAPVLPKGQWAVTVPGSWWACPENGEDIDWQQVATTPGIVAVQPGEIYHLRVSVSEPGAGLDGLVQLKGLTVLKSLNLFVCEHLTDADLANVRNLSSLESFSLLMCDSITDAGLKHLKALPALQFVRLSACAKITAAGVAALRKTMPGCEIVVE